MLKCGCGIVCLMPLLVYLILLLIDSRLEQVAAIKLDCHPLDGATKEKCEALGCVWAPLETPQVDNLGDTNNGPPFNESKWELTMPLRSDIQQPWCSFPKDYVGYKIVEHLENGVILARQRPSGLPDDIQGVRVSLDTIGSTGSVLRLRIGDSDRARFEPEIPTLDVGQINKLGPKGDEFLFEINSSGELEIRRKTTGATVFKTDLKRLIFADQFIQLNTRLDSKFLYGLGEHFANFEKQIDTSKFQTFTFFHSDSTPLPDGRRTYGAFPFYINLDSEHSSKAHGVYLRNVNAMDIILQSDQSITFRTIGGILDFIFFVGPTPLDVIQQYQSLIGLPPMPPIWSLGFHLCRYDYGSSQETEKVLTRTIDNGIPLEVQWNDIDFMKHHNDFTYDTNAYQDLPNLVNRIHEKNLHYIPIFDAGVSQEPNYEPYSLGQKMDIFVKNASNQILVGKVWNDSGRTVFPDFSNPLSRQYWYRLFGLMHRMIEFDGAWIDMNDISNFVDGSLDGCPTDDKYENPPYVPGRAPLREHTLCMSAKHMAGIEYNVHNLYSFYMSIATYEALNRIRPGKRPFVVSRSTSPGQQSYSSHWSGDIVSSWDYLKWSIQSLVEHSMYGYSMMGSDICGFRGDTDVELCARWSTLGAFYTFSRNHNDRLRREQDPVAMGSIVIDANKNAIKKKYYYLPYLYTLMHKANKHGEPVVRSAAHEFFDQGLTGLKSLEYQFMWGKALMISPIVDEKTNIKKSYLPRGRWFEIRIKPSNVTRVPKMIESKGDYYLSNDVDLTDLVLFQRAETIVATYPESKMSISELVNQSIGLDVALCPCQKAAGDLFIDDGENLGDQYSFLTMRANNDNQELTIKLVRSDYKNSVPFGKVNIYGMMKEINSIKVNGKEIPFAQSEHMVTFDMNNSIVTSETPLIVKWT